MEHRLGKLGQYMRGWTAHLGFSQDDRSGTDFEQQAALLKHFIDGSKNLVGQLVFFQSVAKPKSGVLIRQAAKGIKLSEFAGQRCIEEGHFHGRVRQAEPLLYEVHALHSLQGERRAAVASLAEERGDESNQSSPGNHGIHLLLRRLFASAPRAQVELKAALFHGY